MRRFVSAFFLNSSVRSKPSLSVAFRWFRKRNPLLFETGGMTLLEMLVAVLMLVVFTGVVVMVMEFTNRFFADAEAGDKGVLVEHAEIQIEMDRLAHVLAQPGITLPRIKKISNAFTDPPPSSCVVSGGDIAGAWGLPIPKTSLPEGYSLCLWTTIPLETNSSPGIYVLQALPAKISASKLPTRRIFCRPRHLC